MPEQLVRRAGAVLALGGTAASRVASVGGSADRLDAALPALDAVLAVLAAADPDLLVEAADPHGLVELLGLERSAGGGALLTRLRLTGRLLDARTVAALDARRPVHAVGSRRARRRAGRAARRARRAPGTRGALAVLAAGLVAAAAVLAVSDPGRALLHRWGL